VFVGPVLDQQGEVRIAEGVQATDEEMLSMDWFVQGVVGSTR
jgi:basic membrane protein A and related proteins